MLGPTSYHGLQTPVHVIPQLRWRETCAGPYCKVESPAQIQFGFRVNTPARLRQMIDNKKTVNVIHTEIVYSQMEDTG
jgi:hypothetical protein